MPIVRYPDPVGHREIWEHAPDAVRLQFETSRIMRQAGIVADMTPNAHEGYFGLLEELDSAVPVPLQATGYRTGPAAGGDYAFVDLIVRGVELAGAATSIGKAVAWLQRSGALELRVSEKGVELLGRWELQRRGLNPDTTMVSLTLRPGQGETVAGVPTQHRGYVVTFEIAGGQLATFGYSLDGLLQAVSLPEP
jgi:hypothetical protein